MNDPQALLEVSELQVSYGRRGRQERVDAVRSASLKILPGQVFGLIGESGSGKTSLARAIIRLAPVTGGEVRLRGATISRLQGAALRAARRSIQYVFQDPAAALNPRRSVRQALQEPLELYRIGTSADRDQRMQRALADVDLGPELLDRYPHQLSGGQVQRAALARALVSEPALIIADEPTSSLDVSAQARVIGLLRALLQARQLALLLISHDLAVVRQLADRVGVMYGGVLVENAPAGRLFEQPAHPYTRELLDSVPRADPRQRTQPPPWPGDLPARLTPSSGCVFHTRCPRCMERCSSEPPASILAGGAAGDHHWVRCHLWS